MRLTGNSEDESFRDPNWNKMDVIEMILCEAQIIRRDFDASSVAVVPAWMLRQLQAYHSKITGRAIEIGQTRKADWVAD